MGTWGLLPVSQSAGIVGAIMRGLLGDRSVPRTSGTTAGPMTDQGNSWAAVTVHCVDSDGTPAMCYRCGEPAQAFINTSVNLASSVPSHMEPVCREHDPYRRSFATENAQL